MLRNVFEVIYLYPHLSLSSVFQERPRVMWFVTCNVTRLEIALNLGNFIIVTYFEPVLEAIYLYFLAQRWSLKWEKVLCFGRVLVTCSSLSSSAVIWCEIYECKYFAPCSKYLILSNFAPIVHGYGCFELLWFSCQISTHYTDSFHWHDQSRLKSPFGSRFHLFTASVVMDSIQK